MRASQAVGDGSYETSDGAPATRTRYLEALRDQWLLIAGLVLVAVAATGIYLAAATTRYEAHAQVVVTPLSADTPAFVGINGLLRNSTQSEPVVTAAQFLGSPAVRDAARQLAGDPASSASVDVAPRSQSDVVDVGVTASSAQDAAVVANAYVDAAIALRNRTIQRQVAATIARLRHRIDAIPKKHATRTEAAIARQFRSRLAQLSTLRGSPDPTMSLLSRATPPTSASYPRPTLSLAVAILCALLLGGALAIVRDRTNQAIRDEDELEAVTGLPVLAHVPYLGDRDLRRTLADPPSAAREAYRLLRSQLSRTGGREPGVVVVCSLTRDESRTGTAIGIARAFADADRRVILVDGDMRQPVASFALGAAIGGGLPDVLRATSALEPSLVPIRSENLQLLPSTPDPAAPDYVASERMARLLSMLRERADLVVIDSPPADEAAEAYAFASLGDAVVVCARPGATDRAGLRSLLRRFARLGIEPAGVVAVGRGVPRPLGQVTAFRRVTQVKREPVAADGVAVIDAGKTV